MGVAGVGVSHEKVSEVGSERGLLKLFRCVAIIHLTSLLVNPGVMIAEKTS